MSHNDDARTIANELIDCYPSEPISFFSNLFATKKLELLSEIASNATFKYILTDTTYKEKLYDGYIENSKNINWEKEILKILEGVTNGKNSN